MQLCWFAVLKSGMKLENPIGILTESDNRNLCGFRWLDTIGYESKSDSRILPRFRNPESYRISSDGRIRSARVSDSLTRVTEIESKTGIDKRDMIKNLFIQYEPFFVQQLAKPSFKSNHKPIFLGCRIDFTDDSSNIRQKKHGKNVNLCLFTEKCLNSLTILV